MVLFITRKYPPSIGGMENFSAGLAKALGEHCLVLALGRSQLHLLWWVPVTFLRALMLAPKVSSIHIGDGVLAGLGAVLAWLTKRPTSITVHGLDITYAKFGYQNYIWPVLKRYTSIIAVSNNTRQILLHHGISESHITVIPNGVYMQDWPGHYSKKDIQPLVERQLTPESFIMITVGRLIKRKGVAWFIENVMPYVPENCMYLIAGAGPEEQYIRALIKKMQLEEQVYLLGRIDDNNLKKLYSAADVFIMPNIEVQNDVEGFGIVAIEAGASGLLVLATNAEGMQDILVDGSTGFLVESTNAEAWKQAISSIISQPRPDKDRIKAITAERFSWETIAKKYQEVFTRLKK